MFLRLVIICLLAAGVSAESIADIFPAGKSEKLSYEIIVPDVNQASSLEIEITRSNGSDPIFTINQVVNISGQDVRITSTEKYIGANMELVSSENIINLPPEVKKAQGADSIAVHAVRERDSIIVASNVPKMMPDSRFPADNNFITSVGSILSARTIDFTPGATRSYNFSNFLIMTGKPFSSSETIDSFIGTEKVSVPAGEFDCYKVLSRSGGTSSFTYFSKDKTHFPVKTEVMDPNGEKPVLLINLMKVD